MTRAEWIWTGIAVGSGMVGVFGAAVMVNGAPWTGFGLIAAGIIGAAIALNRLDRMAWPP